MAHGLNGNKLILFYCACVLNNLLLATRGSCRVRAPSHFVKKATKLNNMKLLAFQAYNGQGEFTGNKICR